MHFAAVVGASQPRVRRSRPPFRWRSNTSPNARASVRISYSARHARRPGRHVVKDKGHRDAGVVAHQGDHVGDADMAECLDCAVVETLWYSTRIGEGNRHFVDDLLTLVRE